MLRQVLRRIGLALIGAFGAVVITFLISHVLPGDPAKVAAGAHARPEQVQQLRHEMHLDLPLPVQFVYFVDGLAHGDLGTSLRTRRPVASDLAVYFPATAELGLTAIFFTVVFGVPLGVVSAVRRGGALDILARTVSSAGVSAPVFWVGIMLQMLFFAKLRWLPIGGRLGAFDTPPPHVTGMYTVDALLAGNVPLFWDAFLHVLLPGLVLAFSSIAVIARLTRDGMLEVLRQDYVRTARAKGLPPRRVIFVHALRNAVLPALTVLGLQVGVILGGSIVVEEVFAWPGIGLYAIKALTTLDFQSILGVALVASAVYLLSSLVVDLTYGLIDPRVRWS